MKQKFNKIIEVKDIKKIAILAGSGALPVHVYDACIRRNIEVVVLGIEEAIDEELAQRTNCDIFPAHAVSKVLKKLKAEEVTHVILAGKVTRANISKLLFDFKGALLFTKIVKSGMNDNSVLKTVIKFLEKEGFIVVPPEVIANEIIVPKGNITNIIPDKSALNDIKKGVKILKGMANLGDIGQALIIQSGLVLGVEAAEGTDELIRRCGIIQQKEGEKPVLVKISKPKQDRRVDLPCIGLQTIKNLQEYGVQGVAVESNSALLLDKEETINYANEHNLFIFGV